MKLYEVKTLDVKTYTPEVIAKKHGVSIERINAQLAKGIKVELESA